MSSSILKAGEYERGRILGKGSYGVVSEIKVTAEGELKGKKFAMKEMFITKGEIEKEDGEREYKILKKAISNVTRALGSDYDPSIPVFRFSMDLYEGGNLQKFVEGKQIVSFKIFMSIFCDIMTGTKLFSKKIKSCEKKIQVSMGFGRKE